MHNRGGQGMTIVTIMTRRGMMPQQWLVRQCNVHKHLGVGTEWVSMPKKKNDTQTNVIGFHSSYFIVDIISFRNHLCCIGQFWVRRVVQLNAPKDHNEWFLVSHLDRNLWILYNIGPWSHMCDYIFIIYILFTYQKKKKEKITMRPRSKDSIRAHILSSTC